MSPVLQILDYLTHLVELGRATSTVRGYITAISKRHTLVEGHALALHPLVAQWRKGLCQMKPVTSPALPSWHLEMP